MGKTPPKGIVQTSRLITLHAAKAHARGYYTVRLSGEEQGRCELVPMSRAK